MCDRETLDHETDARRKAGWMPRRDFNLLAFSLAAVATLPLAAAEAFEVEESTVEVKTADGNADALFVRPAKGVHPGVVMWPDLLGLRPAFASMARKLAQSGYSVLAVNHYYRNARAPIVDKADFDDTAAIERCRSFAAALSIDTIVRDNEAVLAFLDAQEQVDHERKYGVMGYCMTGSWTLRAAAAFPDRIGAAASFHGGGLAADGATSPLQVIAKMRAEALIAIAENDDAKEPEAKTKLRKAFDQAGLKAEIEVYQAPHGWCMPDMLTRYHEAEAQRAWSRLLALLARAL